MELPTLEKSSLSGEWRTSRQSAELHKRSHCGIGNQPIVVRSSLNFSSEKYLLTYSSTPSHKNPKSDITQLRAKIKSLDSQLFNAELELDVLRRAMTLAKTDMERIVDERANALSCINQCRVSPQLPTEIVLEIAERLRWNQWYKRESDHCGDSYASLRAMANAFSVVGGMEDAILRKIPLVLLDSKSRRVEDESWLRTFADLPTGQREIIGANPRFCHFDDNDVISRIQAQEEVHLVLSSYNGTSNISSRLVHRPAGHLHLILVRNTGVGLQDFANKFLNPTLVSRISTLMLVNTLPDSRFGASNTLSIEPPGDAYFERASIPLLAFVRFPAHLTILEMNNVSPISIGKLGEMANALCAIRSSLQSLRLIGPRDPEDGVYGDAIGQGPVIPITMDFPFLQELCFESLDDNDLSALMGVAHLECASLNSFVIRSLCVPTWKRSWMPGLFAMLVEKIPSKFPRLHQLACTVRLSHEKNKYERVRALVF